MTHQIEAYNLFYKKKIVLVPVRGLKMAKNVPMLAIFAIFRPLRGIKTLQKHFYLIEEVLSFYLVGHM